MGSTLLHPFSALYTCIGSEHRIALLALAALICATASFTTAILLGQAGSASNIGKRNWSIMAGISLGLGAWCTHYVAFIGFLPAQGVDSAAPLTLASLMLALLPCTMALEGFVRAPSHRMLASAIIAGGLGAMHYTGVSALDMPGLIRWDSTLIAISLILPATLLYPAVPMALGAHNNYVRTACAAILTTFAIFLLHLSGMAALTLTPSRGAAPTTTISPTILALLIGAGSLAVFSFCIILGLVRRQADKAIDHSERKFAGLVRAVAEYAIILLDAQGRICEWNTGACNLTGYTQQDIIGMPLARLFSIDDIADDLPALTLAHARRHGTSSGECLWRRRDGSTFWGHGTIQATRADDGELLGYSMVMRDVSSFKQARDLVALTSVRLDTALSNMHEGLCLFDAKHELVLCNERFREFWGLAIEDTQAGTSLAALVEAGFMNPDGKEHAMPALLQYRQMLKETLRSPAQVPIVVEFGKGKAISVAHRPLSDGGWVMTCNDISLQRQSEERIKHMALHDVLTGLPNRTRFIERLEAKLALADQIDTRVAVIAIDLDRFKEINDTQGHAAGDRLLQAIGARLIQESHESEVVARLGGDEFAAAKIFCDDSELAMFIERIQACIKGAQDHPSTSIGASLGVAIYPQDGLSREVLLNNADLAMYRAKAMRGETACYYEPGMDEIARQRRELAHDLRHALDRGEMHLLYQPQRSLHSGDLSGYEALLRWRHPRRGLVSPDEFIPVAEESGAIFAIGEWVLREACREACRWSAPLKVAVNLSAVQFLQADLVDVIHKALVETGLAADRLELEITETAIIADKLRALHCLRQIKAMGVNVAIDDFGTGYSSLDTLHSFPFDKIKIDKSFLIKSENSPEARAIIRAVLALGKSLNIPVLAEGVETEAHLMVLLAEGCDEAQGYFFGRPAQPPSQETMQAVNS